MVDTGYPHADAQSDFQRQRRRQVLSQLAARLRREPDDVSEVLPYDEVVAALGGAGETVTRPERIGPALDRAFAAGVPYLVNVHTDPEVAYPRSTTGL